MCWDGVYDYGPAERVRVSAGVAPVVCTRRPDAVALAMGKDRRGSGQAGELA